MRPQEPPEESLQGAATHRIVVFCGPNHWLVAPIIRGLRDAVSARDGVQIVGICLLEPPNYLRSIAGHLVRNLLRPVKATQGQVPFGDVLLPWPLNFTGLTRELGAKLYLIPDGNVNSSKFLEGLKSGVNPNTIMSILFPRKFGPELLSMFDQSINYHNGYLPRFRGLMATGWARYMGEKGSAYCQAWIRGRYCCRKQSPRSRRSTTTESNPGRRDWQP